MQKIKITAALVAVAALALPAVAAAHVTVQPEELPAGTFTRMDVRVPTERDDAGTVKVDVELPDGFYFVSYEPVAGWDVKVTTREARRAGRDRARVRGDRAGHPGHLDRRRRGRDRSRPARSRTSASRC